MLNAAAEFVFQSLVQPVEVNSSSWEEIEQSG